MGDLEPWMSEEYLHSMWNSIGENVQIKLVRNKYSDSSNYCFVDFASPDAAQKALSMLNGTLMPNSNRPFRLNWASGGGAQELRTEERSPDYAIFVGDLGPEVEDATLLGFFKSVYPSTTSAKVIVDPNTGVSRSYGFVHFADEVEQQRALVEMQGQPCGTRSIRISLATQRSKFQPPTSRALGVNGNTTVFVGGLDPALDESSLRAAFSPFGEITHVKIPVGKKCGFVTFVRHESAELAIANMNGYAWNGSKIRVNWGRLQTNVGGERSRTLGGQHNAKQQGLSNGYPVGHIAGSM